MGAFTSFFAMAWSRGCRRPCFGCIVKKDLGPDECQQLTLSRGFCGKWSEPCMCEPVAARDIWLVNRAFSKKDLRRRHGLLAYHQLHEVAVGSGDCVAGGTGYVFRGSLLCADKKKKKTCVGFFPLCRPWFMTVFFSEETKSKWTTAMKCGGMMVSFVDWTHMFGPAYGFGACK
jgi:hypothetical protein